MATKSRIKGVDDIFKKTEIDNYQEESKNVQTPSSRLFIEISADLKQRLKVYCAQNNITLKDFINNAIIENINK